MHSEKFYKKLDKGIYPLDKLLNIKWPVKKKIMSPKDKKLRSSKYFKGSPKEQLECLKKGAEYIQNLSNNINSNFFLLWELE